MTTCKTISPRLTAYLDGELTDGDGSVVRGHLRECAACRQAATDEAALRDGLRALPSVDPPSTLWAGVQARLAAAEVADARTPSWRRAVARWSRWMPSLPRLASGGMVAAAAVALLYWRGHRAEPPQIAHGGDDPGHVVVIPRTEIQPMHQTIPVAVAGDVTADLLAEPARTTETYDQVIEELMKLVSEARPRWSDERGRAFDARIAALRTNVERAGKGRPQQRAQGAMIRYLQDAVVHGDDIVFASGGAR